MPYYRATNRAVRANYKGGEKIMAATKFYAWEKLTFPWQYAVKIPYNHRVWLTNALALELGLTKPLMVSKVKRGSSGDASKGWGGFVIRLPNRNHKCSLGLIVHEITHCLAPWRAHHSKPFRSLLCGTMAKTKCQRLVAKCYRDKRARDAGRKTIKRRMVKRWNETPYLVAARSRGNV